MGKAPEWEPRIVVESGSACPADPVRVRGGGRRDQSVSLPQPAPPVVPLVVPVEVQVVVIAIDAQAPARGVRVVRASMTANTMGMDQV